MFVISEFEVEAGSSEIQSQPRLHETVFKKKCQKVTLVSVTGDWFVMGALIGSLKTWQCALSELISSIGMLKIKKKDDFLDKVAETL